MNGQSSPNVAQQFSAYPGASSIDPEPPSMVDVVSVTAAGIVKPDISGIGEVVPASDDVAVDAESVMLVVVVVVVSSGTVVDVASVVTRVVASEVVAIIIVDVVVPVASVVVDSD